MTTREAIKALLAEACPGWEVTYEAAKLMNVNAQGLPSDARFIYIEEFTTGKFMRPVGRPGKTSRTKVQIYFCKFLPEGASNTPINRAGSMDSPAEKRELIREEIVRDAVEPLLDAFAASPVFINQPSEIPFAYPVPRFADGEVSVLIELDVQMNAVC